MILSHLVVVLQSTASKAFAGSPATFETSGLAPLCHKGSLYLHMIEECHEHRLQPQLLQTDTHLSYKSCKSWKLNQHLRSLTNGNKLCDNPTGWEHKEHRGQSSVKVTALIRSKFPFSCIGQFKLMRVLHERAPMCDRATRSQDWFAAKIWRSDKCSWKCNLTVPCWNRWIWKQLPEDENLHRNPGNRAPLDPMFLINTCVVMSENVNVL
jgi:hypothetical protein